MSRHTRVVAATATALVLSGLSTLPSAAPASADDDPLATYRHHAGVPITVHRDDRGRVDFVGSRGHGAQPLGRSADPTRAARTQLGRVGKVLGTDSRDLRAERTTPSVGGGTVTRFQQYVGGLRVLGGEAVVGLDDSRGLSSASTSLSTSPSAADTASTHRVSRDQAVKTAEAVVGRDHPGAGRLSVSDQGTWLYDDQVVEGPAIGQAPVYRFEVGDGAGVREQVLVLAGTGGVLLHVDEIEGINRRVCDDRDQRDTIDVDMPYADPPCTADEAVRTEDGAASSVTQVEKIYGAIGATSDLYASLGIDLTDLIGLDEGGTKTLAATARFCEPKVIADDGTVVYDSGCPMANAYWDGTQFYAGDGMEADDVIGHELTHGVIGRNADLFYWGQSGAINESMADVMGQIVDAREGTDDDSAWNLGEDATGGPGRNAKNPTLHQQPDKMTSSLWSADTLATDNGGVHTNSGVGNHTAYLISQGGSFNGVTVGTGTAGSGIDGSDKTLAKTAALYLYAIQHLVSGAEYADLAGALTSGCSYLVSQQAAGFTSADCTTVANAVKATELTKAPTVANTSRPATVSTACPTGGVDRTALTVSTNESSSTGDLWYHAPDTANGIPANARDTDGSAFGLDPDTARSSSMLSNTFTVPAGSKRTYVRFAHWYLFDWLPAGAVDTKTHYYDGGQLQVWVNGTQATIPSSAWANGPQQAVELTNPTAPVTGFGGDSHGWVSSRVELTAWAGKSVQLRWVVRGDSNFSYVGWYVDQASLYSCTATPLTNTVRPTVSGARAVGRTLTASKGTWSPAATSWSYQWLRSGAAISGATKQTYALTAADHGKAISVRVRAGSTSWAGGMTGVATSYVTAAIAYGTITGVKPRINGTRKVGRTLSATYAGWKPSGVRHTFRWYRNGVAIKGATHSTYKLTRADHGKQISVHVTGTKAGYRTLTVGSARTTAIRY